MKSNHSRRPSCIETLESRIAPASVLIYTDTDGDSVRVIATHGNLTGHATFDNATDHHQLQTLDLTDHSFSNSNITVRVTRAPGGDGQANIGYIDATGNDLGRVLVPGDLGRISAGDGNAGHAAITRLFVRSMGALGTSTQAGGSPQTSLGATSGSLALLIGDPATGTSGTLPTLLQEAGDLLQRPDLSDAARRLLAQLVSDGQTILSQTAGDQGTPDHLSGNLAGLLSTLVKDVHNVSALEQSNPGLLGADFTGLLGTTGAQATPLISLDGTPATIPVDLNGLPGGTLGATAGGGTGGLPGDLIGGLFGMGTGTTTVTPVVTPTVMPVVNLLQEIDTALHGSSPEILSGITPAVATLVGNTATELDPVLNGTTPLTPGVLHDLALLQSTLESALHMGDLSAAAQPVLAALSHSIAGLLGHENSNGTSGAQDLVTSDLNGNLGQFRSRFDVDEVFLNVHGNIGNILIRGSLLGGQDTNSGEVYASGNIGRTVVEGNLVGGDNLNTGLIHAGGRVNLIRIGGSLLGGSGNDSGALAVNSDVNRVAILGDVTGHDGLFSGSITDGAGSLRTLIIRGSLISGSDIPAATVTATDSIGNLVIGRGILADATHRAAVTAGGIHAQAGDQDRAFGHVRVNGLVNDLDLMAGYDLALNPVNGSAGIGSVFVRGNVTASNIVAGVDNHSAGNDFGEATDRMIATRNPDIVSRISAIVVRGGILGTSAAGDHFGVEAGEIDRVVLNSGLLPIAAGPGNDQEELSSDTHDVTIREVAAA